MTELAQQLKIAPRSRRKRPQMRASAIAPLRRFEDRYKAKVITLLNSLLPVLTQKVMPHYQGWVDGYQGRLHTDDEFEIITAIFNGLRVGIFERESAWTTKVRAASSVVAAAVSKHNKETLKNQVGDVEERVLSVDPFVTEPWLLPLSRNWVTQNVSLITSVQRSFLGDVEQIIYRMVREGGSKAEVQAELMHRYMLSKNRARLIARDQVNKYNGQLTEIRQTNLGIKEYDWNTVQDQRVRGDPTGTYPKAKPSHFIMQNVRCRWDDPTVYWNSKKWVKRTGKMPKAHPGEEIQCRCFGLPVLDDLLL